MLVILLSGNIDAVFGATLAEEIMFGVIVQENVNIAFDFLGCRPPPHRSSSRQCPHNLVASEWRLWKQCQSLLLDTSFSQNLQALGFQAFMLHVYKI